MDDIEEKRPEEVEDKTSVKQCREVSSGVYIKGSVEDVPILFTADTGASRTVISTRVYEKIDKEKQPTLQKSSCLVGAGGSSIQERGKGLFAVRLGTQERSIEAIVADIEDEALLGFDVLKGGSQGAADILLSQNMIILDGVEIPCVQVRRSDIVKRVAKVDINGNPRRTEVLEGVSNRKGDKWSDRRANYLVESGKFFRERFGSLKATAQIDCSVGRTRSVLNPLTHTVNLRQNAGIAIEEKTVQVSSTITEEDPNVREKFIHCIQRVGVKAKRGSSEKEN